MDSVATAPPIGAANVNQANDERQNIGEKDIFLKLLVAQMQNQDPLNPSDSTQMSAQLAQFNMVEQQTNTNKWLEQIALAQGGGGSPDSAASYLGKTVTVNQNVIDFSGMPQGFSIDLAGNANQSYVVILDQGGTPVRTMTLGTLGAGSNPMSWDGMTDSGSPAPSGRYTIEVMASDAEGADVPAVIQRSGVVDAVRMDTLGVQLIVAGTAVDISDVTEIRL